MKSLAVLSLLLSCSQGAASPPPAARPSGPPARLILHDWFGEGPVPTPSYVREHRERLDSGLFDGLAIYVRTPDGSLNVSSTAFSDTPLEYDAIASALEPVKDLRFKHLANNFAAVLGGRPPDFADDWSVPIANFARLARAARAAGLRGIYFDNENYAKPWGDYPRGVSHPEKLLAEYQELARLRGRQLMAEALKEFPDITVIVLHGPYLSEPAAPRGLFPQWQRANELMGPFFAGLVEGSGETACVVDGGELYHLRTHDEFSRSGHWRKTLFPSAETNCAFLTPALRASWGSRVSIGFGVMDRPFGGQDMDPETLAVTLAGALRNADKYVWLYVEGKSFLCPPEQGGAEDSWLAAVRRGRRDAAKDKGN